MRPHNFLARGVDHLQILVLVCISVHFSSISSQLLIATIDTRRGEYITGFYVRSGLWLDGIAIMTSLGRKSQVFGNPAGGSGHTLIPPRGYTIAGVSGSCASWIDGFGIILTR
ncbi:hypothetical protein DSL72_000868 [Monilinia vaccinii-corymbosi]|uniref:Jacalin-type lectin domain-containing protein n=1 Tax=Monilinia vaccinii-corymbosi TaxID=61207 RepID=A0A8A3P084_9HELO|nr:hypothetical protein DSL72_000868 [Monilinia vaccinii-corymbosi]